MSYNEIVKEKNDTVLERCQLVTERISSLIEELEGNINKQIDEIYEGYFLKAAKLLLKIKETFQLVEGGQLKTYSIGQLQQLNNELYGMVKGEAYESSYANPVVCEKKFGQEYGQVLCFLFAEFQRLVPFAFEQRLLELTIYMELFIEVYNYFETEEENRLKNIKTAIYYFNRDYSELFIEALQQEQFNPEWDFAVSIIMDSDLQDLRYLYFFGEHITENELKIASFLNQLPQEKIDSIARTYTEGFRLGFEIAKLDLSKKKVVNIRYSVGFERIVRAAILQFRQQGLQTTIFRASNGSRSGFHGTSPNRQFDYDHRFDSALYMDKALIEQKLKYLKAAYEKKKEMVSVFAGPALIEIFGERPFSPVTKKEALKLSEKQQELSIYYQRESAILFNEYVKNEETSFTIISYPIPEIGEHFEEIFEETIQVNTLDLDQYRRIQQCIIDTLDKGEYVTITGCNKNRTNLKICLHTLNNPEKETNFENCLADVNIPVGEVFTSPKLAGTEGTLHVTKVFLHDLQYIDLELQFKDGMIINYHCSNFETEEENKTYIKENLLYQRETLPIGEFAIGTNTTAYRMGKKYQISHLLPILIAEKTGPHFAVGDTCYKMSEEIRVYNPDGKEIVAKDNECSIVRKEDISKAYFNCHTDITIPYDELGEISVCTKEGENITIISNGRFVLPGTEQLNEALDSLEKL